MSGFVLTCESILRRKYSGKRIMSSTLTHHLKSSPEVAKSMRKDAQYCLFMGHLKVYKL